LIFGVHYKPNPFQKVSFTHVELNSRGKHEIEIGDQSKTILVE